MYIENCNVYDLNSAYNQPICTTCDSGYTLKNNICIDIGSSTTGPVVDTRNDQDPFISIKLEM